MCLLPLLCDVFSYQYLYITLQTFSPFELTPFQAEAVTWLQFYATHYLFPTLSTFLHYFQVVVPTWDMISWYDVPAVLLLLDMTLRVIEGVGGSLLRLIYLLLRGPLQRMRRYGLLMLIQSIVLVHLINPLVWLPDLVARHDFLHVLRHDIRYKMSVSFDVNLGFLYHPPVPNDLGITYLNGPRPPGIPPRRSHFKTQLKPSFLGLKVHITVRKSSPCYVSKPDPSPPDEEMDDASFASAMSELDPVDELDEDLVNDLNEDDLFYDAIEVIDDEDEVDPVIWFRQATRSENEFCRSSQAQALRCGFVAARVILKCVLYELVPTTWKKLKSVC